jgi:hypothetical protein
MNTTFLYNNLGGKEYEYSDKRVHHVELDKTYNHQIKEMIKKVKKAAMPGSAPSLSHMNTHLGVARRDRTIQRSFAAKNLMCPRFLAVCGLFSCAYAALIYKSYYSENHVMRVAGSGSLTFLASELSFFPLDAINLTQKLHSTNVSTMQMLRTVYNHYGPYGIYRGFTTSYYSATIAGFAFFGIYKGLKVKMREVFKPRTQAQCSLIYTVASIVAEGLSMIIYYPYEIIKVRYIAKNDIYQYRGITHGLASIFKQEGFIGLYRGYNFFLVNYVGSYSIQLVFYESYMDVKKRKWGLAEFHRNENRYVIEAALLGGAISGILMNSFECVMYLRMADMEKTKTILDIYRE